jgi:hypothetical protein
MQTSFWQTTGLGDSMNLSPDLPIGRPSFALSEDQIATVIGLLCCGAADAKGLVTTGMLEVPITILVRKAILRCKRQRGLTNIQIGGEYELLDIDAPDTTVLGRIDVILQFLHQFGDEDAYLGVECKRVSPDDSSLNLRYVTQGVDRFATGQYAAGHHWGIMLGYVLALPMDELIGSIDSRIRERYGDAAGMDAGGIHPNALSMSKSALPQGDGGHIIRLVHLFVEMTTAGPAHPIPLS